ncbi:MAG: MarR family transcriptional regulator, partial [Marinovum sp.]|nr:MarR family transcriptional regulator [Marinovum sp.]
MTTALPPNSRSLPIALIRAREGVMLPIRQMLSETGITEQQWRVLRVLAEYGVMDAKTLADRS